MLLRIVFIMCLTGMFLRPSFIDAFEVAPRISDREIVERLTRLEEGHKNIDKRFDDLRSEMNSRFSEMNSRFDTLQWMFGLFITVSLVILGFVLRMQWQMQKRQTAMETSLETQKDSPR